MVLAFASSKKSRLEFWKLFAKCSCNKVGQEIAENISLFSPTFWDSALCFALFYLYFVFVFCFALCAVPPCCCYCFVVCKAHRKCPNFESDHCGNAWQQTTRAQKRTDMYLNIYIIIYGVKVVLIMYALYKVKSP